MFASFFGNERARESIAAFAKKGLGCTTTVALETGEGGMDGLSEGLYDALITIGSFSHPDVDCVPVGTVGPGVLMAEDHPLASRDEVSLAELAQYGVAASSSFDSFNDSIVTLYRKRGVDLRFITVASENVQRHIFEDYGVAFLANVPSLGDMLPGTVMKPMISGDSIAVPLCLITLKSHKAPMYCAFEKWLEGALLLLGGGFFRKESP